MWTLRYYPSWFGHGWLYSKPNSAIGPAGMMIKFDTCWWFPVKPTKKQLRQARKNKLY